MSYRIAKIETRLLHQRLNEAIASLDTLTNLSKKMPYRDRTEILNDLEDLRFLIDSIAEKAGATAIEFDPDWDEGYRPPSSTHQEFEL